MSDNIRIDIPRSELASLIVDAWHDGAAATSERLLAALDARDRAQPYIVGEWGHLFEEGRRERERTCRIVFDVAANQVTHMDVRLASKWRASTAIERADLTDSLVNANSDSIDNPQDWDLARASSLPEWAEDRLARLAA
jgi:hypothetical protein